MKKYFVKVLWFLLATVAGYFINKFLDWAIFLNLREVTIKSSSVTINRPGSEIDLSLYYFLIALIILLIVAIFLSLKEKQVYRNNKISFIVMGILVIICIYTLSLTRLAPIAKVDAYTEISGTTKNPIAFSYLFVRPTKFGQCWLQEPAPLLIDPNGKWRAGAFFGGISEERFELIAIVSQIKLDLFAKPGGYDCSKIPQKIERFVRVVELK